MQNFQEFLTGVPPRCLNGPMVLRAHEPTIGRNDYNKVATIPHDPPEFLVRLALDYSITLQDINAKDSVKGLIAKRDGIDGPQAHLPQMSARPIPRSHR